MVSEIVSRRRPKVHGRNAELLRNQKRHGGDAGRLRNFEGLIVIPAFSLLNTRVFVVTAWGVVLIVLFAALDERAGVWPMTAAAALGMFSALWGLKTAAREFGIPFRNLLARAANIVTLSRLVFVYWGLLLGLLGMIWTSFNGDEQAEILCVLSPVLVGVAFLSDLVDGQIARRSRNQDPVYRVIGGWLDAEVDSMCFVIFSLLLAMLGGQWLLLIGLFRYVFGLLFRVFPLTFIFPPWFKWASKGVSAFSQVALLTAWLVALFDRDDIGTEFLDAVTAWPLIASVVLLGLSFLTETVLRIRFIREKFGGEKGSAFKGLFRSVQVYHNLPFRQTRLRRLYSRFLKPGDLAFDVGAHVGNRIRAFRDLGCKVVAFEPQSSCLPLLENWFGGIQDLTIRAAALGAEEGRSQFHVSTKNPTLSTASGDWIVALEKVESFAGTSWDLVEQVEVSTLDIAIEKYGKPAFVKIDVEGFEEMVLRGLSVRLPCISFEYLPGSLAPALACLRILEDMGGYEYNLSIGELSRLKYKTWTSGTVIDAFLSNLAALDKSGDIYARCIARFDIEPGDDEPGRG